MTQICKFVFLSSQLQEKKLRYRQHNPVQFSSNVENIHANK